MLAIGEFSKLCGISARMLRHYDLMGLLRPALVGENGYRYYDAAQVPDLVKIEGLKSYGFSLAEIRELQQLPESELGERLHKKRLASYASLNKMRAAIRKLEQEIIKLEGIGVNMDQYHVIVMEAPAQRVLGIRRTINIAQTKQLFDELRREMAARGLRRNGATQLVYLGEAFDYDNMDVEAQVEVAGDHEDVQILREGLFVATTHTGPYETLHNAYDAICAWMERHPEYKVAGPGIERYLKDESSVASPEEYETGVLFRIKNN